MMANALKDLLPAVEDMAPSPFPAVALPQDSEEPTVFGGLDMLFQTPAPEEAVVPPVDEQSKRVEAWSHGLLDAERLLREEQRKEQQRLKAIFEEERRALAGLVHANLSDHIADQIASMRDELANQMAEMLEPFLEQQAHDLMLSRFSQMAEAALHAAIAPSPMLQGPKQLLEALADCQDAPRLGTLAREGRETRSPIDGKSRDIELLEELSLTLDKTVFETRLTAFMAQLREAVRNDY